MFRCADGLWKEVETAQILNRWGPQTTNFV